MGGGNFGEKVWECACGQGHISEQLKQYGIEVYSTDLFDRGYGESGIDFLKCTDKVDMNIVTNPPYKYAQEFVEKALELVTEGNRVIMLLRIQFLESKRRRKLFDRGELKTVWVSSSRMFCAKDGDFEKAKNQNAMCFAWFEWEKGYTGEPTIRWIA